MTRPGKITRTASCPAQVELGPGPAWLCCDFPPGHTDQHYDGTAKVRWGSGELAENPDTVRQAVHDALAALADELDRLDTGLDPGLGHYAFVAAADKARFRAVLARDGLPCPDTGITHCAACHGADGDPDGPRCGHYAGCPEC